MAARRLGGGRPSRARAAAFIRAVIGFAPGPRNPMVLQIIKTNSFCDGAPCLPDGRDQTPLVYVPGAAQAPIRRHAHDQRRALRAVTAIKGPTVGLSTNGAHQCARNCRRGGDGSDSRVRRASRSIAISTRKSASNESKPAGLLIAGAHAVAAANLRITVA